MAAVMMLFILVIVVAATATVITLVVMKTVNANNRRPYLPPPPGPGPLPPPHPGTTADFGGPQVSPSPAHRLSAGDRERIMVLLRGGQKIQAIKLYRAVTGVGLREAKDAVEHLERYQ